MKRLIEFAIAVSCAAAVCSCTGCRQPEPPSEKKVIVGYLPMVSSLTYFVAMEKGFFFDEHLSIDARPINTSNDIATALVNGNINAGIELSVVPLLKTITKEPPRFRIFSTSSITSENGFDAVVVLQDSKVKELRDLSGKKVAVFPGTTAAHTFLSVFAEKYPGLAPPILQPLAPSLHIQSLLQGSVDAVHAYEPTLTIARVQKKCRVIHTSLYADQLSPNPIGVAAVNAAWFDGNRETAAALFRALDKAVEYIRDSPDDAKRILAKYTGSEPAVAAQMNLMPMSVSTEVDASQLDKYILDLVKIKEIDKPIAARDIVLGR